MIWPYILAYVTMGFLFWMLTDDSRNLDKDERLVSDILRGIFWPFYLIPWVIHLITSKLFGALYTGSKKLYRRNFPKYDETAPDEFEEGKPTTF